MFTVLGKVLMVILGLVIGAIPRGRETRPFTQVLSATLDLLASFALTWVVAVQLGVFKVKPLESRGYDAIGELIGVLALLALKAIACIVIPAVLLCMLLRRIDGLTWRLVAYSLLSVVGIGGWYLQEQRAAAMQEIAAMERRAAEDRSRSQKSDAQMMEEARANAELREREAQARLAEHALELSLEARKRWRADIEAAGATGLEGDMPYFIAARQAGPYEYQVTNLMGKRVCVNVVRFMRKPGTDVYLRCQFDEHRACRVIASRRTENFTLLSDENLPACASRQFEYRIGTPRNPEPSWWSRSALAAFDQSRPDGREAFMNQSIIGLRGEIASYEKMLAEPERAARWRAELEALTQR
jgi:hypothetical protein